MLPSRSPVGSGTLYPSLPGRLRADVRRFLDAASATPRRAVGVLTPHGRIADAGAAMGAAFASVHVPATSIVLAPRHDPDAGDGGAILLDTAYRTPLGDVPPDVELGAALAERAGPLVAEDADAHAAEPGIEVVLPFLQMRNSETRIVPIIVGWSDWERTARLASAIHEAIGRRDDVLLVASSDMNAGEPESITADKDTLALDRVIAGDAQGLLQVTAEHRIGMCGAAAVACALEVARLAGKPAGEVVGYTHSGVAGARTDRVTGYAAALIGIG
jgi:AmmeMemoRadiSam system protein B